MNKSPRIALVTGGGRGIGKAIALELSRSFTSVAINYLHDKESAEKTVELITKAAAIPILTVAGQAFRGGFSSQSISRDGVSESVSYTSSAIYGIYSATIEEYKTWIKENLVGIRSRYLNLINI